MTSQLKLFVKAFSSCFPEPKFNDKRPIVAGCRTPITAFFLNTISSTLQMTGYNFNQKSSFLTELDLCIATNDRMTVYSSARLELTRLILLCATQMRQSLYNPCI